MTKKNLKILKVIDKTEKHYTDKGLLWDLPMRLLVVGKSHLSGKTNFVVNLLLQDDFYRTNFHGGDMFIVSGSINNDSKLKTLIKSKDIPDTNLFTKYDEDELEALYEYIQDEFQNDIEEKQKPKNYLLFIDDMSFGGNFTRKSNGILARIFSNGRHINLSIILTAQKYTDIPTSARENSSGAVFFSCSDKQLDLITDDHNYHNKKVFKKMFRENTNEKHSFMVVNYSNNIDNRYLNKEFLPILINV